MIAGIHISQEIFANNILTALKPSLEHNRKHILRLLRLYGEQALKLGIHISVTAKPGLHIVATVAEYACDDASKRILRRLRTDLLNPKFGS